MVRNNVDVDQMCGPIEASKRHAFDKTEYNHYLGVKTNKFQFMGFVFFFFFR